MTQVNLMGRPLIEAEWRKLLQDIEIGKNYHVPIQLAGLFGPKIQNPVLEGMLATRLFINLVSLLDDFLEVLRIDQSLKFAKGTKQDLNGRIETLRTVLEDPDELHKMRNLRNRLAHQTDGYTDWPNLDKGLDTFHAELNYCGWDTDRPKYEFFGEKSRAKDSDDPNVLFASDLSFGIRLDGQWVIKMETQLRTHRSGS